LAFLAVEVFDFAVGKATMSGSILSVNVSARKGEAKRPVPEVVLREAHGIEGDAHAGPGERQVSLLAWESVEAQLERMREKGVACSKTKALAGGDGGVPDDPYHLDPGDYAENLTLRGVDLKSVKPGDRIELASGALLEVTRIGKECHQRCAVFERLGDCVMPREGVFAKVVRGGAIKAGDAVAVSGSEA
jgi:MOSC domain-containing protein YiiM